MSADSTIMILINRVDSKFDPSKNEDVKLEDPITWLKKLLGNKTPGDAKTENPNSLRGLFGIDIIKNGFYASDNPKAANKERDIFKFPIPEKVPDFNYERYKVTLEDLFKFVFPSNLEHSNSTGRLDIFALYGPTVAYHSVDKSFCMSCTKIAKKWLNARNELESMEETKRMGVSQTTNLLAKT